MEVHLVDGTYELFRHYFALPKISRADGQEIAAVRGVVNSVLSMLERGATHIGVATDHVVESFRNDLFPYYKTSLGVPDDLLSQFFILEEALQALGVLVWPMVEFEADDALAAAADLAARDPRVERVLICTPDKDLSQCVSGQHVVQHDRRRDITYDEVGVIAKFGVHPRSIPDYLAVVGDAADGYPGLPGWGAKAAAAVFSRYVRLEDVPDEAKNWDPSIRGAAKLNSTLRQYWTEALLYRTLATLRLDVPVFASVDDLEWKAPAASFLSVCKDLRSTGSFSRAELLTRGAKRS